MVVLGCIIAISMPLEPGEQMDLFPLIGMRNGDVLRCYPDKDVNRYDHHTAVRYHDKVLVVSPYSHNYNLRYETIDQWVRSYEGDELNFTVLVNECLKFPLIHAIRTLESRGKIPTRTENEREAYCQDIRAAHSLMRQENGGVVRWFRVGIPLTPTKSVRFYAHDNFNEFFQTL